ncbi:MAG: Gfo/Idh/MocA family oxidoreductase [Sphaerochaeta sp.]|nr:Gfo/Idh/MocA family oxidoreductase [Sphaerochaeta sp.]
MKKLGIAIIGCGNIAPAHLEGYGHLPSMCEVRALCDLYTDKAQRLATRFNLEGCTITADYRDLLARDDIAVVSLCLPPSAHCQVTVDFMDAGKHVIVEKPMAPSLAECDVMIEAQQKSGKILSVISQNRFRVAPMRIKEMLDRGLFGNVLLSRVNSMWWRGSNYYDLWWRGTYEKEGGGCTLNHAVHQIDILQWLIGMPKSVLSVMGNVAHTNSEVEDVSMSILRYDGMLAQVNSSLVDHDEKQEFFFAAEAASFAIPWHVKAVEQLPNGFFKPNPAQEAALNAHYAALPTLAVEAHSAQIEDVLLSVQRGTAPLVDGTEGRKAVELITAMYKSSTEGHEVALPLAADDPFYTTEGMMARMVRYHKKLKSVENLEESEITLGTM